MNRYCVLLATIAGMLAAGCASVAPSSSSEPRDKSYVTGSRLPQRDGGTSADVKTVGDKSDIDDIMQRRSISVPAKSGGGM